MKPTADGARRRGQGRPRPEAGRDGRGPGPGRRSRRQARRRRGRPGGLPRSRGRAPPRGDQRAGRPVHDPPAEARDDERRVSGYMADYPWLVASAPGFGIGWAEAAAGPTDPAERTVTLGRGGPADRGAGHRPRGPARRRAPGQAQRLWSAQGRPGRLDRQGPQRAPRATSGRGWRPAARRDPRRSRRKTGADGRFRLAGHRPRPDRRPARHGPGDRHDPGQRFCRPEPEIRRSATPDDESKTLSSSTPRSSSSPCRRPSGSRGSSATRTSGKPIAGVEIKAAVFDGAA